MGAAKKSQETQSLIEVEDLKSQVSDAVADESFDLAIERLQAFLEQPSEYPQYRQRLERLVSHAIDLVNAIRAKKNFPGMTSLTRSKQQELMERTTDHYNELQSTMVKMDRIILQLKREDIRSTLWILRAIIYAAGLIVIIAFLQEVTGGLWGVFELVMENTLDGVINWVVNLF
jgi:hypothetical protein